MIYGYSQTTIKSKYSSLLSCASSGFHLLLDTALTDDSSSHSLSEVGCKNLPTIVYVVFVHWRAQKCAHAEFLTIVIEHSCSQLEIIKIGM